MRFVLLEDNIVLDAIIDTLRGWIENFFSWTSNSGVNNVISKFQTPANNVVNSIDSGSLSSVMDSLVPIGICMAMIYLSKEFFEKTTLNNIDLEQIFKLFLKLIIVAVLISNVKPIIVGFNNFSNLLTDQMKTTLGSTTDIGGTWDNIQSDMGLDDSNGTAFGDLADANDDGGTFVTYALELFGAINRVLIMAIYTIAISAVGLSRAIAIGYQAIYAPIAVSNIVGYGTRNAAISFLKRFFAVFMQMPIAYLGVFLAVRASNTLLLGGSSHPVVGIVVFCMGIPWVTGSARISKELFG